MATLLQAGIAAGANPSTEVSGAFSSVVSAGSRIVVEVRSAGISTYTSSMVTDALGTPFVCDVTSTRGFGVYSGLTPSSGSDTIVFKGPGAGARLGLLAWEYSGLSTFSGLSTNATGTSSQANSSSIDLTAPTGIAFGICLTASAPSSWEADYNTDPIGNGTGRIYGAVHPIASSGAENALVSFAGSVSWVAGVSWYADVAAATGRISKLAGDGGGLVGPPRWLVG